MHCYSLYTCFATVALLALLPSCDSGTGDKKPNIDTVVAQPVAPQQPDTSLANTTDIDTSEYATVYLVVADTGQDYYSLRDKMRAIATAHKWTIDTMGRYYNKIKKEIVLPDDDEDEMYRGEYFPRRTTSNTLSLEYYVSYNDRSTAKNIALVTAICEDAQQADSLLTLVKQDAPQAFIHKTSLYMGCMH